MSGSSLSLTGKMSGFFLLFLACVVAGAAHAGTLSNQLASHPSPYLALHGSDPVAWQEWNADTVARAKRENKLLFVSVGYFACHWCHVMQRESYKNPRRSPPSSTAISSRSRSTANSTAGWTMPCRIFRARSMASRAGR
jgi:hypothetical protein